MIVYPGVEHRSMVNQVLKIMSRNSEKFSRKKTQLGKWRWLKKGSKKMPKFIHLVQLNLKEFPAPFQRRAIKCT